MQTEVREQERRLESQVFVSGRCIGKRQCGIPADAVEEAIQELARAQHRWLVEAVREGFVDDVLNQEAGEETGGAVSRLGEDLRRRSDASLPSSLRRVRCGIGGADCKLEDRVIFRRAGIALLRMMPESQRCSLALGDGTAELEVRARLEGRETSAALPRKIRKRVNARRGYNQGYEAWNANWR